jgi:hypothetical protein
MRIGSCGPHAGRKSEARRTLLPSRR